MSESDENDFEDDGRTLQSNAPHACRQIFRCRRDDNETVQLEDDEDDIDVVSQGGSIHFNQSLQNCDNEIDRRSTYSSALVPDANRCFNSNQGSSILRLHTLGVRRPLSPSHMRAENPAVMLNRQLTVQK